MSSEDWSLYGMAFFYFIAGVNHFIMPKFYLKIIPPQLPSPKILNSLSGAAEVLLAILLLFPTTKNVAAWGIILLLIAVFPANIYHYKITKPKLKWAVLLRLPFQFLFIYWAWLHTS